MNLPTYEEVHDIRIFIRITDCNVNSVFLYHSNGQNDFCVCCTFSCVSIVSVYNFFISQTKEKKEQDCIAICGLLYSSS